MKTLQQVYKDLSNGKLTRAEALAQIKAMKLNQQTANHSILIARPLWQETSLILKAYEGSLIDGQHELILFDLPKINKKQLEALVSYSHSAQLTVMQNNNIAQGYAEAALFCFERVKSILKGKPQRNVHLQIVVPNDQTGVLLTGLSALLKTANQENSLVTGQVILADPQTTTEALAKQLKNNQARVADSVIKYHEGKRYVLKWQSIEANHKEHQIAFKDQGVYLITGGFGALGTLFTKEIFQQCSHAKVILTGRSHLSNDEKNAVIKNILAEFPDKENQLVYRQVDLNNLPQVREVMDEIIQENKQLQGIIHSAGMNEDNFILKKSSAEFTRVLAPKVTGTFNLDEASKNIDLDFFILFSSVASSFGNMGQADYASANGFMDQFSAYRNQLINSKKRHGQTRAINWPLWQEGGMSIDQDRLDTLRKESGIYSLQTSKGMQTFYNSLMLPHGQILVMEGELDKLHQTLQREQTIRQTNKPTISEVKAPLASKPNSKTDLNDMLEKTQNHLRKQFSSLLKMPSHQIDTQAVLEKYGIDSILAINLTNQLEKTFGSLPKTLFFEYQTINELADYFIQSHSEKLTNIFYPQEILNENNGNAVTVITDETETKRKRFSAKNKRSKFSDLLTKNPTEIAQKTVAKTKDSMSSEPIAIIGLSGRYPEAVDVDAYWHNLRDGKDCVIEVPKERWDWQQFYTEDRTKSGHHYSKWGGFIAGVDEFDPRFFNISPKEAKTIDPQERLFLQHAWMAVEDAGYTRASLQVAAEQEQAGQVGVYAGVMYGEYNLSGSLATIANRVSYVLNLHGPSMTLDTMCSSSLTAIHLACQDLKQGRTSLGIAGGVNVSIHPSKYMMLSSEQFISGSGHCQSFGEGGDGYIPGEGVGVVLLKRLSEAQSDGDHIYGVIKSSILNHGGKTNGYSVPNPKAQANAIYRALSESKTDPRHVSYIEAHGTGTKLGDPIEIAALSKAFTQSVEEISNQDKAFGVCAIGSAKSNIGHCESAAGIAGLTKVLLQMKHQQIVPSLHSAKLNPHIDFDKTPFFVNQTLESWQQPIVDNKQQLRIAGLSSFGAGGSNAHFIVEEYLNEEVEKTEQNTQVIIPLSARTEVQLQQKARDLLTFIELNSAKNLSSSGEVKKLSLLNMAFTLQLGREGMDKRLGFIVSNIEQLAEKLQEYIKGEHDLDDTYQGEINNNKGTLSLFSTDVDLQQTLDKWIVDKKLEKLTVLWVTGQELEWNKFYSANKPQRISLPTYPFAKDRYWIDPVEADNQLFTTSNTAVIHPLLHSNTSDLFQQSYSSVLTGNEFFLQEHPISQQQTLGPMAHLEMVRAAVENAMPNTKEAVIELHNIVWAQVLPVNKQNRVSIALSADDNEHINFEIYGQDEESDEIVFCQGQAILCSHVEPAKLDIDQLKGQMKLIISADHKESTAIYQAENNLLADLKLANGSSGSLANTLSNEKGDFVLHPTLLDNALKVSAALIDDSKTHFTQQVLFPDAIASLRIISPCTQDMLVWARRSTNSQFLGTETGVNLDIDLIDQQGNICLQIFGISYQQALFESIEVTLDQVVDQPKSLAEKVQYIEPIVSTIEVKKELKTEPKKINYMAARLQKISSITIKKPTSITLTTPQFSTKLADFNSETKSALITLSNRNIESAVLEKSVNSADDVSLYDNGNGIFAIKIVESSGVQTLNKNIIEQLQLALAKLKQNSSVKVVILSGAGHSFLTGDRNACNEAVEQSLYQAIVAFPCPVIAVMQGVATGAGFLTGALCDFMICSQKGKYAYTDISTGLYPTSQEDLLFKERFGEILSNDFLYLSESFSGQQLKETGWNCAILPDAQVDEYALQLASKLATKPQASLRLLKQHLSRDLVGLVNNLTLADTHLIKKYQPSDNDQETEEITSPVKHIQLSTLSNHVAVIQIGVAKSKYGIKALLGHLRTLFTRINKSDHYKAIVIASEYTNFLPDSKRDEKTIEGLQHLLLNSSKPVIGALDGSVRGVSWFVTQFFDACVYQKQGSYCADNFWRDSQLAKNAMMIFSHSFGGYLAKEILLTPTEYLGVELQKKAGNIKLADQDQVLSSAIKLAESWVRLPLPVLLARKKEVTIKIQEEIANLPVWTEDIEQVEKFKSDLAITHDSPHIISLNSKVISASVYPESILMVKMADKQAKNMFSDDFIEGMNEVFAHIEQTPAYKVVILTGYDNYFASGGTKEGLLEIQEGKGKFTDINVFQLPMNCKLPVIAAMQGHGIGAGWSMGMFADFSLFSEESKYMSPYMNYGFTPGAGATLIFPEKIGYELARETLLTAQEYSGSELKERGLPCPVFSRDKIYPAAMALAEKLAQNSRASLIAFKQQWTNELGSAVEQTYQLELAMHDQTFVGKTSTLEQIHDKFLSTEPVLKKEVVEGDEIVQQGNLNVPETLNDNHIDLSAVTATLKKLLAIELHMEENEIEEEAQFVDLGLDSITGVTWTRNINEKYHTTIEATKVYNYSTINQMSRYVKAQAELLVTLPEKQADSIKVNSNTINAAVVQPNVVNINIVQSNTDLLPSITASLKKLLAAELHMEVDEVEEDAQFIDLGLDSITGVTWVRKINDKYKTSIEATKVYSYPTLNEMSTYVKEQAEKQGSLPVISNTNNPVIPIQTRQVMAEPKNKSIPVILKGKVLSSWRKPESLRARSMPTSTNQLSPIAVIGMAGQFPHSSNLEEYWDNIALGKSCISEITQKRWNLNDYYQEGAVVPGKTNSRWMGTMEEYDFFDPLFFTISPTEAESMDPQQRVFLQNCWHTIENAGYDAKSLSGSKCGVFVGCAAGDYGLISREQQTSAQGFTGGATSILAARVSYFLNLQGPCLSIDTACSSSLVAIANACDSLNLANSDIALAGGVYVMTSPDLHIKSSQAGMLSTDGRCFAFDQRANGFVPGEGVGVVMLKRLVDAQRDKDNIMGVIQGWGVNQDGKTNGITAPNPESQTRLQQDVYDKFGIDPANIQLMEAHGTGTKLGDPIEVEGLKKSFKKYTENQHYCALGSVKSNIGHCLTAAAVAGFIKLILAMKHKKLPPTINFEKINEHITLKDSPFYVNNKLKEWNVTDNERRQAAISSFGFSGTNAHMVIAEYQTPISIKPQATVITQSDKVIVPLSARTTEQLEQKAQDLLAFIQDNQEVSLSDIAYTLQVGRSEMEERVGFMVSNVEQLVEKLAAYIDGQDDVEDVYQGQVKSNKAGIRLISQDEDLKATMLAKWIGQRKLSKLLDLWCKGLVLDWNALYGEIKPQRISLPNYPFSKERYWIEVTENVQQQITPSGTKQFLHPLLHANTSVLEIQNQSSAFGGEDSFLNESKVNMDGNTLQKPKLIGLPTYPFAKERCWVDTTVSQQSSQKSLRSDENLMTSKDLGSIEEILNKIDIDSIETEKAVELLNTLM